MMEEIAIKCMVALFQFRGAVCKNEKRRKIFKKMLCTSRTAQQKMSSLSGI